MSCDFLSLAAPGVRGLHPYQPGKPIEELERELGIGDIVKLASNENPLGPGPLAREAASRALAAGLQWYPDGNGFTLKQKIAALHGLEMNRITLGNGSNDVLELLARAFLTPEHESVFSAHAFAVYPIVTQAIGARAVVTPAREWGHDLDAMAAAITPATRLVFIANPNNPTGTWLGADALERFVAGVPEQVIVVVDEAYTEYLEGGESAADWVDRYSNLVVTRTFSKAYGLAGLRVGYALSHPGVADLLNRVRQPFNVNSVALATAAAALDDREHIARSVALNRDGMVWLEGEFRRLGLEWIPSKGNFISVNVGRPGDDLFEALLREGVIVRPVGGYGMPDHLRVTIGLPEENRRFIQALEKVLGC
jgi:histidinol-phosphate aminotransferase